MKNPYPGPIHDEEVLSEAESLLRQMHLSPIRGGFVEGRHVVVAIEPHGNDDDTVRGLVTCVARGHRSVDWRRLVVWLEDESEGRSTGVRALNARGQAWLPAVPAGRYGVHAETWKVKRVSLPRLSEAAPSYAHAADGAAAADAAAPQGAAWLERPPQVLSVMDRKILITVRLADGAVRIAFETREPELANRGVRFALASEEGGEQISGEVVFEAVPGRPDIWEGVWKGDVDFGGVCQIAFELKPAAGT